MPVDWLKDLAKEVGKTTKELEKYWVKAKGITSEFFGKAEKDFGNREYSYVVGTVKNMLGLDESISADSFMDSDKSAKEFIEDATVISGEFDIGDISKKKKKKDDDDEEEELEEQDDDAELERERRERERKAQQVFKDKEREMNQKDKEKEDKERDREEREKERDKEEAEREKEKEKRDKESEKDREEREKEREKDKKKSKPKGKTKDITTQEPKKKDITTQKPKTKDITKEAWRGSNKSIWMSDFQDEVIRLAPEYLGKIDWDDPTYMYMQGMKVTEAAKKYVRIKSKKEAISENKYGDDQ